MADPNTTIDRAALLVLFGQHELQQSFCKRIGGFGKSRQKRVGRGKLRQVHVPLTTRSRMCPPQRARIIALQW